MGGSGSCRWVEPPVLAWPGRNWHCIGAHGRRDERRIRRPLLCAAVVLWLPGSRRGQPSRCSRRVGRRRASRICVAASRNCVRGRRGEGQPCTVENAIHAAPLTHGCVGLRLTMRKRMGGTRGPGRGCASCAPVDRGPRDHDRGQVEVRKMYAVGPVSRVKPVRMPSIVSSTSTDFSPSAPPPGTRANDGGGGGRGARCAAPAVAGTGLLRRAPASRTQRGQVRRRPPASASKCVRPRERTTLVPNASASDLDIRRV